MTKSGGIVATAILVAILAFAGCVPASSSREMPQGPTEVSNIVSAMSSARIFGFTSTLTDNYTVVEASAALTDSWLWEGRTDADLARSVAYVTMNTTDLTYALATRFRWEMYLVDGWQYYSQTTPGGGTGNPWSRRKLEADNPLFSNSA